MTFELERLILGAQRELVRPACEFDGHDWISEGGRGCPMGAEGCSQAVYVCRSCGVYDYLSLIHISEPTRPVCSSRMPSSA